MNAGTNTAIGRLKIFAILGCCPFEKMDYPMEFSPIDEVAKTILILSETPKECVIFHPINQHNISMDDVIHAMQANGLPIKFVEQEDFQAAWKTAEENPDKAKILTSMIAYRSKAPKLSPSREIIRTPCKFCIDLATVGRLLCGIMSKNLSTC